MKEKLLYICSSIVSKAINGRKNPADYKVRNILLVKLDDIGDMVYTLHIFSLLHKRYPEATLHLQAKKVNHIFFKHIPYVQVFAPETQLPNIPFDLMFDLRGNFKSLWYAFRKSIPFYYDRGTVRLRNKYSGQKQEIYTNYEIVKPVLGQVDFEYPAIRLSQAELDFAKEWCADKNISNYFLIHAGANAAERRWPAERFASLAAYIQQKLNCEIILVGGPSDKNISEQIRQNCKVKAFIAAGEFDLLQFAALCQGAKGFLGNESGPLHIATASNIPVIALFGAGVKDVFYPYSDQAQILHHFDPSGKQKTGLSVSKISEQEVMSAVDLLAG